MNLSEAIRKRIAILLKEKGWKIWDLCKETGVPCSTITTFINGKTSLIKLDTLLHICEGFRITLSDFFNHPVFKDVEAD